MIQQRYNKAASNSLLQRYGLQLGQILERHRAEMALLAAKQEAEKAALQARKAMRQAQSADHTKTAFLANVSHELRTPLNAIVDCSDMMTSVQDLSPEKLEEYARSISASGQHLLDLIDDILDLAKVEAGKLSLKESEVQVAEVVRSCLTRVGERAREQGLELTAALPEDLPLLYADERKLKQIFINLLSNAVKFTPAGGKVAVKVAQDCDGALLVRISDTGIGIAIQDVARVLAPFEQIEHTPGIRPEGTGLGLPLTKALVELHGGRLGIRSEVGSGTEVILRFPSERVRRPAGSPADGDPTTKPDQGQ